MDNLTHSLVGAVIGQAGLKRNTGLAMPALIIGANLPDVDAACFLWLDGAEHLGFRRGITHGPIAWLVLPLLLAGLLYGWDRWQAKRGKRPAARDPVRFRWLYALSLIGCLTHPALDWLNVYGIRLLEPFSSRWFYGDVLFIIDVWLWALLIVGVWWSRRQEKRGENWRRPAVIAGALGLLYIGANGAISHHAHELADARYNQSDLRSEIIASPVPISFWKREVLSGGPGTWWVDDYVFGAGLRERGFIGRWCAMDIVQYRSLWGRSPEADAFLFWSRALMFEPAGDGSMLLQDARFYDPRARDRFTVALPDVECDPLTPPSP